MLNQYKIGLTALLLCMISIQMSAQSIYQPYSYQFYQKFGNELYSIKTRLHSTIKPYFVEDSLLKHTYDSLMNIGMSYSAKSWGKRKLFDEHLIDIKQSGFSLYGDVLPDIQIGHDFSGNNVVCRTTLGYQMGGTIGSKISFYGSVYGNRARLPTYINDFANNSSYIPGEGKDLNPGQNIKDWFYSTLLLSYTPVKYVNFTLGKDKTFIGDGYRSMLLSDFASNYPFFKITATLGNVRYMTMYAYMNSPNAPKIPNSNETRKKWGYFQYLDWNVSNRISIGFFQNAMAATTAPNGQKRGFDFTEFSPFMLLWPNDYSEYDPNKNLLGLTSKYKLLDKLIIYGQFALNEFQAKDFFTSNGSSANKSAIQLGLRGTELFHIKGLNYLAEYNTARPYTYSSFNQTSNYSQNGQSLAHPFGANFREWLGILNYTTGRIDFQVKFNYAYYGLDINGLDYGQDIFKPWVDAVTKYGNYVGQGLKTDFYYAEGRVAYILNPKYNLRIELGAFYRDEKNSQLTNKTTMFTIGLRSSFRDIYTDF